MCIRDRGLEQGREEEGPEQLARIGPLGAGEESMALAEDLPLADVEEDLSLIHI